MRQLKIGIGLTAAVAVLAVGATPALAHDFVSSGGVTKGKGEAQTFKFGPFKIECAKATSTGSTAAGESETFYASIKPQRCRTEAKIGNNPFFLGTHFVTPLAIEYHANGFVEIGSEGEEIEGQATLKGGTVELRIHAIKCVIKLPEQTVPRAAEKNPLGEFKAATYSNQEEVRGKKTFHKVAFLNEFKNIHFEYGEGQCEEFKASEEERKGGKYEGELVEEVRGGNLEYN